MAKAKKTPTKKATTKTAATKKATKTASKQPASKKTPISAISSGKKAAGPTYEQIAARAYEIYADRFAHGKPGTPEGDWFEAERQLRGG
jgi:hypothetical protein